MSDKRNHRKASRSRRSTTHKKKSAAKINYGGFEIELPPELDLPAGAPFDEEPRMEPALSIPSDIKELLIPLAAVATNAWRAKAKMVDPQTGESYEEMRRVYRFVEGIFKALEDAGMRVFDPKGKAYDSGMALKVLSFEPTPGLTREEIIETIRPSIVWHDRLIQMGEVIVGTSATIEQDHAASGTTTNHSPKTACQESVLSESSITGSEVAEQVDASSKCQRDTELVRDVPLPNAPAEESPSRDPNFNANNQPEGAGNEQNND